MDKQLVQHAVLIVDDTLESLRVLSTILQTHGYRVRTAINGTMALQTIHVAPPDIILLDIRLPDRDGYEVCTLLKNDKKTRHIPVIFISALDDTLDKARAFAAGGIDYITKPFQTEEVVARLDHHLSIQQTREALRTSEERYRAILQEQVQTEEKLRLVNEQLSQTVAELEQHKREYAILNRMSSFLHRSENSEEAYTISLPFMRELFPDQTGALYILNSNKQHLQPVASWGDETLHAKTISARKCWALAGGRVHLVEDERDSLECDCYEEEPPPPYICVQLTTRGETLGVLHLIPDKDLSEQERHHWVRLVIMVADLLALALSNIQLREKLREQSTRDSLTGLYNRRFFDEVLAREISHARRHDRALSIILFDIDEFKHLNTTYGYEIGDILLQKMAQLLLLRSRRSDFACRFGGDEMVLLLSESSLENTRRRAEELSTEMKTIQLEINGEFIPLLTVSVGVAHYPNHGLTTRDLTRAADNALYRAKYEGRNRVCIANPIEDEQL